MIKIKENEVKKELGKFFTLTKETTEDLKMPGGIIDEYWHEMLKDTNRYSEFCEKYAGYYVIHVEAGGVDVLDWVKRYEKEYGKLNKLWFTDKNGFFKGSEYEEYEKTGIVKMSWDCKPKIVL